MKTLTLLIVASVISLFLGLHLGNQTATPFDEVPQTPVWQKTVHVTNAQIRTWYLETEIYTPVPSVDDCLIVIQRKDGKWDYNDAWIIVPKEELQKLAEQGIKILQQHITPIIDVALPDISVEITIGYPILSNKMLIMLPPEFDQDKQKYEELAAMVNYVIIERRELK